jgi:hypothetical protein
MYYDGKKIGSCTLSDEVKGLAEYVSNDIASYTTYNCAYCTYPFYLVDPHTYDAGGAIQCEFIKYKDTGEVLGIKRTLAVCLSCIRYMLQRQQQERS